MTYLELYGTDFHISFHIVFKFCHFFILFTFFQICLQNWVLMSARSPRRLELVFLYISQFFKNKNKYKTVEFYVAKQAQNSLIFTPNQE